MVGQLDATHVERGGINRNLGRVGDEHELRVGVDMVADEPGAGGAVDVNVGAGGPLHGRASEASVRGVARASTAMRAESRSGGGK